MGDESSFRSRRDDLTGSAPGARAPGGNVRDAEDALAELARMIGDQDPFADFAEVSRAPPPQPEPPTRLRVPRSDAPTRAPASPPVERRFEDWQPGRRTNGGREATLPPQAPAPYGTEGLTQRPRAPEPTIVRPAYDPNAGAEDPRTAVRQGYGSLAARRAAEAPAPSYAPEPTVARGAQGGEAYGQPQYAQPAYAPQGRAAPAREDEAAGYAYGAKSDEAYDEYDDAYDPTYDEEGYMPPHGEEVYDEEPRRRRGRTALIAVACLIGLGVAATAGIFAYRMGGSGSGTVSASGGDAPVIKADSTPTKVAAPSPEGAPGGDGQKLIYDRVGNAQPGKEKVVPREEQPVDVNAAAAAAPPAAGAPAAAPANATEPKKVRTVAVRADGTVVASASPVSVPPATGVAPTAYAPTQNPAPTGLPTPTPVATMPTNGAGIPVASAGQANATPPQATASGGYVVQVSSQKSEADALGSWKVLQGRYPQLLGNYKATVRKADLGDKGVYYRAQVGPFASRDDAISLCNNLRAQGGDCVVTKN
ncbi:SPOR domain-containing protein [Aquabacter sp. L1I39]|uniref:SPOR domain-containing protein n=1 Tax=Aquabacter sp. L1I39 TaxID=2820278 RepID=UPI001ADCEABA|nr:SPOR domain-containing protein [Aquabacter sp. L1I39]QTL01590.1 SPOR domain-containing protein [Aquabacter sp. L1I39]